MLCVQLTAEIVKSRAACAQSIAQWQLATIEAMFAITITIDCSRYTYDGVILHAHPIRGESHNQHNTTGEVSTLPERDNLMVGYFIKISSLESRVTDRYLSRIIPSKR